MTISTDREVIIPSNGVGEKVKDVEDSASVARVHRGSHLAYRKKSSTGGSSVSTSYRVVHTTGSIIRTIFPILSWVSYYPLKKYFLFGDLWAGIYIGLYLIPQCMAYSVMSNTPAIFAFYTCIIASVIYAIFGSCRRISYGVYSLVTAVYLGIIIKRHAKTNDYIAVTSVFTFTVGAFSAAAGLLRVGSMVRFVPYEIMSAFRAGLYILVFSMQLNSIFGIDLIAQMDLGENRDLLELPRLYSKHLYPHMKDHINWNCVAITLVCAAVIAIFRLVNAFWYRLVGQRGQLVKNIIRLVPVEFIVVAIGFLVAHYKADLVTKYKLPLVGTLKLGNANDSLFDITHLHLEWPKFNVYFGKIWMECITATILVVFYTHSLAIDYNVDDTEVKPYRSKVKRLINPRRVKYVRLGWKQYCPNRELLTQAGTNLVASFLKCLPCGPSATRSARLRNVGGRSQIAGLVSAIVLLGLWFGLKKYLPDTPQCIVASVVALDALLAFCDEVLKLKHFWSVSSIDLLVWMLTLASFIFLNLEFSLYASLALSLLVFLFRSKLFTPFHFDPQRNVVTNTNTNLIVPEKVLTQSCSKFDLTEDQDDSTPANGGANIFSFISPTKLRDIQIYRMEQRYLTVSNVDGFVRDVFRRLGSSMKTEVATKLVFDCRKLAYLDWQSVRVVKATVLRTIEIAESWKQQPKPLFFFSGEGSLEKADKAEDRSDEQMIVVVFVFRTKLVQLVHNAGKLNVHFYPTLHKSLHIGMKGAIYSILSLPSNDSGSSSNESNEPSPSTSANHKKMSIQSPLPAPPPPPEIEEDKIFSRKHSEEEIELRSPKGKIPRPKLKSNYSKSTDAKNGTIRNVTPLSFRQNDDEFSPSTSSFGSNISRNSDAPVVRLETFTPPPGVPPPPPPSLSLSQANYEALQSQPSTSSAVIHYPPLNPPSPVSPPPPPPAANQTIMIDMKQTKSASSLSLHNKPSPTSPPLGIPPPPPPPPPPPAPIQPSYLHSPAKSPASSSSTSPAAPVKLQLKHYTLPRASVDTDADLQNNNDFKKRLENLLRPSTPQNSAPQSTVSLNSSTVISIMSDPENQDDTCSLPYTVA